VQGLAELHDRLCQCSLLEGIADVVDEGLVDFQDVDGEALQVAERGVAGAEVVDGEGHAEQLQLQHLGDDGLGVLHEHALGDLEHERGRVEVRRPHGPGNVVVEALVLEVAGGDVHAHAEAACEVVVSLPFGCLRARLLEHPASEGDDETRLLGDGDELLRLQQPELRVVPAHEGFHPDRLAALEVDDGLVVEDELPLVHRSLQLGRAFEPLHHGRLQGRLVHLVTVLAAGLGGIHGHVRRLQDLRGVLGPDSAQGDPDAAVYLHLVVLDGEGRFQVDDDALGQLAGVVGSFGLLEEDGEFVASETSGRVAGPEGGGEPRRHGDEELVPGGVPEAVVHDFEVVEVEEQDCERRARAPRPLEGVLEAVPEQGAVGEPAKSVVERLVFQLLLEPGALADVAHGEDDALDRRVAQEVVGHDLDMTPAVVAMADAPVGGDRSPGPEGHAGVGRQRLLDIVGMDEGRETYAVERAGLVAEGSLRRGGLVGDCRVGAGDQDDVGGVLHEGLEASFAATGMERLGEGLPVEGEVHLGGEGFERVGQLGWELTGAADADQALQLVGRHERAEKQPLARGALARRREGPRRGRAGGHLAGGEPLAHLRGQVDEVDGGVRRPETRASDDLECSGLAGDGKGDVEDVGGVAGELAHGRHGRFVHGFATGGSYELRRGLPEDLLARDRRLVGAHEAGHAQEHEEEHGAGHDGDDGSIDGVAEGGLDEQHGGCDERHHRQQRQPGATRAKRPDSLRGRQLPHGGVQGGRSPAAVKDDPTDVEGVAVVPVPGRVEVDQAVDRVGNERPHRPDGK